MIKARQEFNHSTGKYFLGTKIICRTNRVTKWYDNDNHTTYTWYWDNPSEPVLGPTCLSAWSK